MREPRREGCTQTYARRVRLELSTTAFAGGLLSFGSMLAGCGGSAPSYSLSATYSCLEPRVASVTFHLDDTDYFVFDEVAQRSGGGALHAKLGDNAFIVVFERSIGDAKRTEAAYRDGRVLRPAPESAVDTPDMVDPIRRTRNAVLLWAKPPDEREAALVKRCLSG